MSQFRHQKFKSLLRNSFVPSVAAILGDVGIVAIEVDESATNFSECRDLVSDFAAGRIFQLM